jgi:undecaprenyl pyrophosphate phosphatase UppP
MGLVKKYSYNSFVIYRILLGIIILAYIYIWNYQEPMALL